MPARLSLCLAIVIAVFLPHVASAQAQLRSAQSYLKRGQTNLKAAESAAGPKTARLSGSRARLAKMRAGSARSDFDAVAKALAKLPANDPGVQAVAKSLAVLRKRLAALDARLGGGGAVAKNPTAGTRLDYKQEKLLKDARYYLRELDAWNQTLAQLVTKVQAAPHPDRLDHRVIAQGIALVQKANQRRKFVGDALGQLPANGAGVKPQVVRLQKLTGSLGQSAKALLPVHQRLQKIIHPASYPQLQKDLVRIREIGAMFANPAIFEHEPERAATVAAQAPAAKGELQRVAKKYGLLMLQTTELSKRVNGAVRGCANTLGRFAKELSRQRQTLPKRVRADLASALKMANQAVAEKRPGYFAGGIPQQIEFARTKLQLLEALDAKAAAPVASEMKQTLARIDTMQQSQRAAIIAANTLPPDRYQGEDRAKLIERATAAWKKEQKDANVLGVRIPSETWKRETMWRLQNRTWYRIDRSKLQVQLLVEHDDKLAIIRPINLWIDHMAGDKKTAFPLDSLGNAMPPHRFLPRAKVR